MELFHKMISGLSGISEKQISSTLHLLGEGATIPFISRYRKEATGGLDEVQIEQIKEQHDKLCDIAKRKETILGTITEQGKLTAELKKRINDTWNPTELEDIYLPYKPKRKTRAEAARQKGLEPLATLLLLQRENNLSARAASFVKGEVKDVEDALKGARDIIAEQVNEDERARNAVRNQFSRQAEINAKVVKGKEEEAAKYRDYFDFSEPLKRCTSHRLLAIRRAEAEGLLKVSITPDDEACIERLERQFVRGNNECSEQVSEAAIDAYKRLLKPSIETEFAAQSKEKADDEAIRVFTENLRQLLLAAPLGQKRVLAIDPGFRTGCKVVCLDAQGNLLHNENIYPHPPVGKTGEAASKLRKMVEAYQIEAISIGNGTASRETEDFINQQTFDRQIPVFVVSEQGASIYSASKIARDEFPDYDVTVRGAVSIGRRLMDPLAELVKIDPKSIGVGQYQHDVDQTKLKKALDQTVENCVNLVGVNLNTASSHLLTYISGLGPQLAQNIVNYRAENGAFNSRKELMKVPRMGAKAFEQCAGFLRIPGAKNPLDNTAVHPESYHIVEQMAKDLKCTVNELIADKELRRKINISNYVTPIVGLPTLQDIMQELEKPGRDPRKTIKVFEFDKNVRTIADLREGMILPGIVGNITNFGAFVDIGIKENGLVHLSQLAERYISDPTEIVSIHQHVMVRVMNVDTDRKRIQLSMIGVPQD
ncbi:Tex family protein [Bacteroides finegoldii]|jgi:protein yhgF|uniref:RNA-binding protein n=1 Tax=Bacteroides finegoldii TaxID=338188 RepID=A0A173XDI7_9BACE|nr:Tex family protein [Bacteroides finegoldii]EEX45182.1 Tex-like protein N-terminal domain protein [Bacteroides finegoldii DSM 17565]KAA5215415.1 RNA-binding transcriptional accessory protein [Bacteroides finegoldii]KAA5219192.1 RNA-binding transcriptional accessory protein [Bacteroides finegoldii]KAA5224059.1 RNA-binding transcriptional accessory protein [Bacteroides finegoldii]KAA5228243.1 RNA-binding transcriptional accessory protein [Bacteroides finegoldii]